VTDDGDALRVTSRVRIPRRELLVRATKSGGPGGQHVNTASTKIDLRWNVRTTEALDDTLRALALERLAPRLSADGSIRITASEYRSQAQNREAAEARLVALVAEAIRRPTLRRATKPTRGSIRERLDTKRQRGDRKANRRWRPDEG
jgi:ribosome-associated protein